MSATPTEPAVLTLTTPALLAEVNDGLAQRVCRRLTTSRDVQLVQALAARLTAASVDHARAMLDTTPIETDESFALSLSEVMQRKAPPEIAAFFRDSELVR